MQFLVLSRPVSFPFLCVIGSSLPSDRRTLVCQSRVLQRIATWPRHVLLDPISFSLRTSTWILKAPKRILFIPGQSFSSTRRTARSLRQLDQRAETLGTQTERWRQPSQDDCTGAAGKKSAQNNGRAPEVYCS